MDVEAYLGQFSRNFADQKRQLAEVLARHEGASYVLRVLRSVGRGAESLDEYFSPVGCSTGQVEEVRQLWGGSLPASLEAYLLMFGIVPRGIEMPFWIHFPTILEAKASYEEWRQILIGIRGEDFFDKTGELYSISPDAFHLGNYGGGKFYFVYENFGDPEVFVMDEGVEEGCATSTTGLSFPEIVQNAIGSSSSRVQRTLDSAKSRPPGR